MKDQESSISISLVDSLDVLRLCQYMVCKMVSLGGDSGISPDGSSGGGTEIGVQHPAISATPRQDGP